MSAVPGTAELFIELVDEILRVRGRLASVRKNELSVPGLGSAQLTILTAVVRAPSPPTVAQIARSFGQSRQAVQKVTSELLALDVVAHVDSPPSARARKLIATVKGQALHTQAGHESRGWASRVVNEGDRDELGVAVATLREIRRRLESDASRRKRSTATRGRVAATWRDGPDRLSQRARGDAGAQQYASGECVTCPHLCSPGLLASDALR